MEARGLLIQTEGCGCQGAKWVRTEEVKKVKKVRGGRISVGFLDG